MDRSQNKNGVREKVWWITEIIHHLVSKLLQAAGEKMANQQQQHEKEKMDHSSDKLSLIEDEKVEMSNFARPFHFRAGGNEIKSDEYNKNRSAEFDRNRRRRKVVVRSSCTGSSSRREKMANHQQQQHEKKKIDHFSHKHPLTLIEDEKEEMSKSDEYKKTRSFLRCYGCTEKIASGVPYYRCKEVCPSFCLHHSCAHLPTTIKRFHALFCDDRRDLQLMKRPDENSEDCGLCEEDWYRFAYVCPDSDCRIGIDIRCARKGPNEAKQSFHQHPVQPISYDRGRKEDGDDSQQLVCSICSHIITPIGDPLGGDRALYMYYGCNYCNFIVHPECTDVPPAFQSPHDPRHQMHLEFNYPGSKICKICQEEIDRNTQWAYRYYEWNRNEWECIHYYIHAGYEGCSTSTIRKGDLQHFNHEHPLTLVEKEAPPTLGSTDDHSIAQDCRCCGEKISSVPYYTCIHCKSYDLHKLCARLLREIKHPLHSSCTLQLLTRKYMECDHCKQTFKGFTYNCSPCDFNLDIECALKTQKVEKIFHEHPLFRSLTKGPFNCHACDRDNEGSSYQCTCCKFWLHEQCASLPVVKDNTSHEQHPHELHLVYGIPEKYYGVVVYCRICTKALKRHRWAYHCNLCRYFIHVHDCSNPRREGDGVPIDAVIHLLPHKGEPILEEKVTNGKMTKHHRHPMILFADQLESNVGITSAFKNLIRGSETWPIFLINGKFYSGLTFSFDDGILTMQVTGVELPRYIKHEDHPHVLESTFLNSSTWCNACEQFFFGRGFKCTTCAFTIDTYCALLPRIIKHRYDKHSFFSLTYSAIEGVEEYVCEICEEDVIPRYFYHCAACDQSIHSRCIWKAYVQFDPYYKFDLGRRYVILVPPSEELPKCIICKQKETYGHGFAFKDDDDDEFMVHLTCISEDDVETCSEDDV